MKQVANVNAGGAWGDPVKKVAIQAQYQYARPPLVDYHGTNTGTRFSSIKMRPVYGTAPKIDNWREPTVFRGYVFKVTPGDDFDYECSFVNGKYTGKHTGTAYLHNSNAVWAGMQGSGRYPIDNGSHVEALLEAKASLDRADAQLGVLLAELTKTMAMLTKVLTDLRKYLAFAKKFLYKASGYRNHIVQKVMRTTATKAGRRKIVRLLGKEAANRWLEYQYGWKPLMSDIYGVANLIDQQIQKKRTIRGTADKRSGVAPNYAFKPVNSGLMQVNPQVVAGAFCRLDWSIQNSAARMFNRLGLSNVLDIGWELIPFSFVIDWVVPIGDFLKSMSAGWGLTFKGGSMTKYSTANIDVTWTQYPFIKGAPINYNIRSVSWFRYPVSNDGMLDSQLYVKNPISVTRAVTALALLTQLISRKG